MKIRPETDRRSFLALARATAAAALFPCRAVRARQALNVRIISNYGAENDSLEQVMRDKRFLQKRGVEAELVKVRGPRSNLEGLVKGDADVCALSAYNPLPDIEAGAPVKLIGAAMKLAALAVFSRDPQIGRVNDLRGRSIGIGPKKRLLHVAMVALLRKKGVDPDSVTFVEIGGNAEVFKAVASGTVDAGPSSVVSFYYQSRLGVHSLTDGDMWSELPDFTYQLMYASDRAIAEKREAIVRTLAAHEDLFGFLQAPGSWEAYRKARAEALPRRDAAEAQAVWRFIQEQRPYGRDLAISDARLRYLQRLDASLRVIRRPMPPESVADMSMARDAIRLRG